MLTPLTEIPLKSIANETGKLEIATAPFTNFRIAFHTSTIAPRTMPPFPYQASQLLPASIEYTAIVQAQSMDQANELIRAHWPEAVLTQIEVPRDVTMAVSSVLSHVMGAMQPEPPPPRKRGALLRFWFWFAGEGPFFKN